MEPSEDPLPKWGVTHGWRRVPILSGLQELDPAPRRFLLFIVFNVVSWQCIIGPPLVLFARKIDMPPSWVGFLISFTPLSMLLVVITGLLVTRFGPKRVMFITWTLRNLVACLVFAMPWAMARWGTAAGGYVLMGATFGFCLMRAVGAGGWFPWLHEVVPETQRGAYFSSEAAIAQMLGVIVAIFQAWVLRGDPGPDRFIAIYAAGIAAGFFSTYWMCRVPGGRGAAEPVTIRSDMASYRRTIGDRVFVRFVVVASLCFSTTSWLGAASVLYLRDALGISSRVIMIITALGSLCIMLTIRHWARFAERNGSAQAMHLSLAGHAAASAAFLLLWPGAAWSVWLVAPLMVVASVFGAAFWMTTHRAMLGLVHATDRVGYSNLWTVGTSLMLGLTPIAAGFVIDHGGLWGFRICFLAASIGGLCCAWLCLRVAEGTTRPVPARHRAPLFLRPAATLGRGVRITIGLDESNR